jgi:hypothetical protein
VNSSNIRELIAATTVVVAADSVSAGLPSETRSPGNSFPSQATIPPSVFFCEAPREESLSPVEGRLLAGAMPPSVFYCRS